MNEIIVTMTVDGMLPSLKNQRRIVTNRRTGKPISIKSQAAMEYENHFISKVPNKYKKNYEGPVSLRVRVWYPSKRNDLDVEFLCDLLQKAEIIKNDRQIMHKEAWKGKDADHPRTVFTLYAYEDGSGSPQTTSASPPDGVKITRKGK